MTTVTFGRVEYISFALTLLVSAAIGVFFGQRRDQNTFSGYLLGGKQMTLIPISVSLITAYISGITLIGSATEVYIHGTQVMAATIGYFTTTAFATYFVVPVFYKLQLFSSYEYAELRFGRGVRVLLSALFTIFQLTYIPLTIYGVSSAVSQVTGIGDFWITLVISSVCVFYTTVGGLRGVVYTDTIQGFLMILSTSSVLVLGIIRVGGIQRIMSAASQSDRLHLFDFNPDPTVRLTFWTAFSTGVSHSMLSMAFSPESTQRYTSLPSLRLAQKSTLILCCGMTFFRAVSVLNGLIIYAEFQSCDPLLSEMIRRPDQIVLFFVVKVFSDIKGLAGLFLAGVVCAGLSSMSASLNTMAGTFYYDLLSPVFKVKPSEAKAIQIIKFLVVLIGCICVCLVFFIRKSGSTLNVLVVTSFGLVGPAVGVFLLGLLFPWANKKGAIWAGVSSLLCMMWLTAANLLYKSSGHLVYPTKVMSVDNCPYNFTRPSALPSPSDDSGIPYIYRISVFYYTVLGVVVAIVTGLVVSYLTGFNRLEDVNPDLLSPPVVQFFFPKKRKDYTPVLLRIAESTEADNVKNDGESKLL